jgi:hypothetical protein
MRLFFISPKECKHISELIPGISSVYQLEQEFHPYLSVEFIPNTENAPPPGIILLVGNETIRRKYVFDDPNDIIKLRKLIWKYVRKIYNPTDITDKNGYIKNFIPAQTNKVIQGWQNKKKAMEKEVCCSDKKGTISKMLHTTNSKKKQVSNHPPFNKQLIKHEVYRINNDDQINRKICKKVRFTECGDNYPVGTALHNRCITEVNWVCNNGYPFNKRTHLVTAYREQIKKQVLDYLKKNKMKANKQMLDQIFSSGFYERVGNRIGNKALTYNNVKHAVNDITNTDYNYYSKLIEGFGEKETDLQDNHQKITSNMYLIAGIIIILLFLFMKN